LASTTTTYTYNNLDQLTAVNLPNTTQDLSYTYDARGNMLTEAVTGGATTTYAWDARDRLTAVDLPGGATNELTYVYDAEGRRARQTLSGTVTKYLWDELSQFGDVVAELNASNAVTVSYVLGGSSLISQKRGATTSYYLPDAQGSTRALTSAAAAVTDTYRYSAFGELETQTGTTANSYLYTGQQFDSSTGLYSLRARYYDASIGRFLSRDMYPINRQNPMELNRYVYAVGNPVRWGDPSGHLAIETGLNLSTVSRSIAVGAIQGATGGLIGSTVIYLATVFGVCGPNAQIAMLQTDPLAFIGTGTLIGAATGGFIAAGGSIFGAAGAGYATAAAGGVGAGTAIYDIALNGANPCNVAGLILSVAGGTLGARAAADAIRNARVSNPNDVPEGSPADTPEVVDDGQTPIDTPEDTPYNVGSGDDGLDQWEDDGGAPPGGPYAPPMPRTGAYSDLSAELSGTGLQANHLNQNAAYRTVIPPRNGISVAIEGDVIMQPTSPHGLFHQSLNNFWSQFRGGSPLQRPSNGQYSQALAQALRRAGFSEIEVNYLVTLARDQRLQYGLLETDFVPRIPTR
jgi:RHS repeat-associated protein